MKELPSQSIFLNGFFQTIQNHKGWVKTSHYRFEKSGNFWGVYEKKNSAFGDYFVFTHVYITCESSDPQKLTDTFMKFKEQRKGNGQKTKTVPLVFSN